jgi:hypothetical protein
VAHPRHEDVRQRYGARCGYCGVRENDVAGELTVDHFRPAALGGDDSDDNLVYACVRCNLYKQDYAPAPEDLPKGRRVLHPLRDNLAIHVRLDDQTGRLEALSETGRFHIALLHLNRPPLIAYRMQGRLAELLVAKQRLLEAENRQLRQLLEAQEQYIAELRRLLGSSQ